jgi:hypothetical protein
VSAPSEIKGPIFVLGAPRSGTSVLYKKMAQHPDLAFVSNLTKKYPESMLLTRLILLFRDDHRPTEASKIWRRYSSGDGSARSRRRRDTRGAASCARWSPTT